MRTRLIAGVRWPGIRAARTSASCGRRTGRARSPLPPRSPSPRAAAAREPPRGRVRTAAPRSGERHSGKPAAEMRAPWAAAQSRGCGGCRRGVPPAAVDGADGDPSGGDGSDCPAGRTVYSSGSAPRTAIRPGAAASASGGRYQRSSWPAAKAAHSRGAMRSSAPARTGEAAAMKGRWPRWLTWKRRRFRP